MSEEYTFTLSGLHNQTGKWVELATGFEEEIMANEQISQFSRGGNARLTLMGTEVNTDHFSAFRVQPT